jgi:type I restriction enzyme S subunit
MIKKLDVICSFISGNAWKAAEFIDEGIPIIRINNLNTNDNDFKYWQGDYDKKFLIYKGDLLVSLSGTIKTFQWNGPEALLNQRIVKVTANPDTNQDWVYYQISHVIEQIANKGKHAIIKNLSVNDLKNFEIDVPDFQIQNKIVAILDKARALVKKRQQSIDLLDVLLKAQYLDLFGDSLRNPKHWSLEKINTICDVQSGLTLSESKRKSYTLEIPYLRVANVFRGRIDLSEIKTIRATESELLRTKLEKDDILIVEGHGNINEIGRAATWDINDLQMVHQNHLIRLRINTSKVLKSYLVHFLNSQGGIYKMRSISNSTSGLYTISTGKIKEINVPIPAIEVQESFEYQSNKIYKQQAKIKKGLSDIEMLYNAILQRAFSGKLKFDVSVELNALLDEIDLQKSENDLFSIITNEEYLLNLVHRLNNQEFENQDLYDKAKHATFQLLKEEERVAQEYDKNTKSLKLIVK